jgi:YibE/F-like protein
VRALIALALTMAVVVRVLVPLLLRGVPPIPIAVIIATAITILTVGLTEGFSRASVAAILGTTGALALTALLAAVATVASGFTNAAGTDLAYLQTAEGQGLDLRGLLLAAFMLGAIGVLDDVTVTQAATVEELAGHAGLRGRRLYASAFNVGRSHIAATVNTLFLAYVGASLPLLVLFAVSRQPTVLTLNGEVVSVEIVRTLVGSLGIVAAVPFTTAIATWLASTQAQASLPDQPPRREGRLATALRRPLVALVVGLAAIGVVVAAATAGLGPFIASGPLTPLTPTVFAPSPGPTGAQASEPLPSASDLGPAASLPPVVQLGDVQSVAEGPFQAVVSVVEARVPPASDGQQIVEVRIRYVGSTAFTIRPAAWVALASSGDEFAVTAGTASTPELIAGTIRAGETREGWLEYRLPAKGEDLFLDYRLPDGTTVFSVQLY